MKKNVRKIAIIIVLLAAALIVRWPVHMNQSVNAVKLGPDGSELGCVVIKIDGIGLRSVLLADKFDLEILPFDGTSGLEIESRHFSSVPGHDYLHYTLGVGQRKNYDDRQDDPVEMIERSSVSTWTYHLYSSPECDRLLIHAVSEQDGIAFYLISMTGTHSSEELREYFQAELPSK